MTVANKKVQNADESDEQNLVAVEPTCAVFAQRILNGNQVKQTASVVFTNNTNRKLIFVIRPSKGQAFVIRPLVDFLMPGKSRSVIISMRCDAVEPGKKHSIEVYRDNPTPIGSL
uniref:MSP domain-containing protein n=1 Tax=Parascaris univalens TaxID=6257 RepID=A0A914ZX99_PARUN